MWLLMATGMVVQAENRSLPALALRQADSLASKQVIYHDRVVPFNTLARDFVLKLTGKSSYGGMTPEQVVGGWLLRPEVWQNEPMIYIKSAELRHLLQFLLPMLVLLICLMGKTIACRKDRKSVVDACQS